MRIASNVGWKVRQSRSEKHAVEFDAADLSACGIEGAFSPLFHWRGGRNAMTTTATMTIKMMSSMNMASNDFSVPLF
jgi:hypothetical protein